MVLQFKKYLFLFFAFCTALSQGQAGLFRQPFEEPLVSDVLSFGMTVQNMDRAVAFYTEVLSFKKVTDFTVSGAHIDALFDLSHVKLRVVRLRLGNESLELMEFLSPKEHPIPQDTASDDGMFQHIAIVVSNMEEAYMTLLKKGITNISSKPQHLPFANSDIGEVEIFYFKDPDNHPLQLVHFPPSKGNLKWQRPGNHLFLGIDHKAITVSNMQKSLQFYHTLFGLKITGKSFYQGQESKKLTNIEESKTQVTSINAGYGPGIELIQCIPPITARDMTKNLRHWQIQMRTPTLDKTYQEVLHARTRMISRGVVVLHNENLAFRRAFITLDPDGHTILIVNP